MIENAGAIACPGRCRLPGARLFVRLSSRVVWWPRRRQSYSHRPSGYAVCSLWCYWFSWGRWYSRAKTEAAIAENSSVFSPILVLVGNTAPWVVVAVQGASVVTATQVWSSCSTRNCSCWESACLNIRATGRIQQYRRWRCLSDPPPTTTD